MERDPSRIPDEGIEKDDAVPDEVPLTADLGPDADTDHVVEDPDAEREP